MKARKSKEEFILTANPDELRALADDMEKGWVGLVIGDSTFVDFLHCGEDFNICLHLDQEWFNKKEHQK